MNTNTTPTIAAPRMPVAGSAVPEASKAPSEAVNAPPRGAHEAGLPGLTFGVGPVDDEDALLDAGGLDPLDGGGSS